MKKIKISHIWSPGISWVKSCLIINLIEKFSNKKLVFVSPKDADILIIGPYNIQTISNRILSRFARSVNSVTVKNFIENTQQSLFLRRSQPLKIFICHENFRYNSIEADFSISFDLGVNNENHLRIPVWKENIDWSKHGISREHLNYSNISRFGSFYSSEDLMRPQGEHFLNKKNVCIFTSHMDQPRKTIYEEFSKNFIVDGYGPYFNKNIKGHNSSQFTKQEVMKNYSFNLCPHNNIYPGIYEEKVPESFLSKCLPITWADQNINHDFNPASFVNLNDHIKDNFKEIIYLLKQKEFLQKFVNEPLLLSEPNLSAEIKFAKKILDCL